MSAAALLLSLLFGLFGFLTSLPGIFCVLLGLIMFLALPIVPNATNQFKRFANLHLWLATSMLGRFAIVVSEHGDLLLKRMTFDDLGVEKISFGDEEKEFEDPDASLHYWMGLPFALADEVHGVLFDPRHAALGQRKADADERGEFTAEATGDEWSEYEVHEWKRGVFEMPTRHELVDLSGIRKLVDGGERSEYPKRVEELYRISRTPFESGSGAAQLIMVLLAIIGPFAMCWFIASQGSSATSAGSSVSFGGTILLFGLAANGLFDKLRELHELMNYRELAGFLAVVLPLPATFILLAAFVSPATAIFVFIALGIGFWTLPMFTVLARASDKLAVGYGRFLFKLGLLGYRKPVLEWTPEKYQLREYTRMDGTEDVKWYSLQGSLFGFTYEPGERSWGAEVVSDSEIEGRIEPTTKSSSASNIPAGFARAPEMRRATNYAAFLPKRTNSDAYYLNTGISLARFKESAGGEKSLNRLLWAKQKYGEGGGLGDKTIAMLMVACGFVSLLAGVVVFFLL